MTTEEATNCTYLASIEPDSMLGTINVIKDMPHCEGKKNSVPGEDEWIGAVITPINQDNPIHVELQWVKKLSQCLAISERVVCNKSNKLHKNVKIIYVIV